MTNHRPNLYPGPCCRRHNTTQPEAGEPRVTATCCIDWISDQGNEVKVTPRLYCRACCPVCGGASQCGF